MLPRRCLCSNIIDLNKTRQDKARQDKTRQDKTRQDKTRQDKTRQDTPHYTALHHTTLRYTTLHHTTPHRTHLSMQHICLIALTPLATRNAAAFSQSFLEKQYTMPVLCGPWVSTYRNIEGSTSVVFFDFSLTSKKRFGRSYPGVQFVDG